MFISDSKNKQNSRLEHPPLLWTSARADKARSHHTSPTPQTPYTKKKKKETKQYRTAPKKSQNKTTMNTAKGYPAFPQYKPLYMYRIKIVTFV